MLNKNLQTTKITEKRHIKLSKKEGKLSKFNTRNIKMRLKRAQEWKEKSNENTTKEKKGYGNPAVGSTRKSCRSSGTISEM